MARGPVLRDGGGSSRLDDGGRIEDLVHPVATDLIRRRRGDRELLRIEVAHPREVQPGPRDVADEPDRTRIDLDDLEPPVALVELELDVEDAAIVHLGRGARAARAGTSLTSASGIVTSEQVFAILGGSIRTRRRATIVVIVPSRSTKPSMRTVFDMFPGIHSWSMNVIPAALACSTRRTACVARVDEEPLRAEPPVVAVRLGRLEEPVGQVLVRRAVQVRRIADQQRSADVGCRDDRPALGTDPCRRTARRPRAAARSPGTAAGSRPGGRPRPGSTGRCTGSGRPAGMSSDSQERGERVAVRRLRRASARSVDTSATGR